ncbi:MAG: RsmB/NOP family class I SAM-dependent RNA methyltransferase [Candidatus Woesearchaeota archaeon]
MDQSFFLKRYKSIGGDIQDIQLRKTLRVNTLKISTSEVKRRLEEKGVSLEEIPFVKNAFYYESRFSLGATPEYLLGYYYLQEAASMIPAVVLNPSPGEVVLDMCAAPGSKSTQLCELMNNTGVLIAVEKNRKRAEALSNNLERTGCRNAAVLLKDALEIEAGERFDRILLDAPCSGNYLSEPNWFVKRNIAGILKNSEMQKRLIEKAFKLLKRGGTIVYSTCSLEPEEDEEIVDYAIRVLGMQAEQTGLEIGVPAVLEFNGREYEKSVSLARRLWPHLTGTQGFFIAKLKKG